MSRTWARAAAGTLVAIVLAGCGASTVDGTGTSDRKSATVTVTSSLTGKPLAGATVTAGGQKATTDASGTATLDVTASAQVTVTDDGYVTGHATAAPATKVVLAAGPGASVDYIFDALKSMDYTAAANATHPYEYKYVTRATVIATLRKSDTDGYSLVSYTVKSIATVTWAFTGCNGKGARSFPGAAAITLTEVSNTPKGTEETDTETIHLVQDGSSWKFFPRVPGCNG